MNGALRKVTRGGVGHFTYTVTPLVSVGDTVTYRLTVTNRGRTAAKAVKVIDQPLGPSALVSANTAGGRCGTSLPLTCHLGTLKPGQQRLVTVQLQVWHPGRLVNHAVTGTPTRAIESGEDDAAVRVKEPHRSTQHFPGLG